MKFGRLPKNGKEFSNAFEKRVKQTIAAHKLLAGRTNLVVAASGGKDSTTVMHLLKRLGYDFCALTVDTHIGCYTKENLLNVKSYCKENNIPLKVIDFHDEFGYSVQYLHEAMKEAGLNIKSCTVCGVPRRYLLNKYTRSMGADVVVTGHNLDDECQSIVMNFLRNNLQLSARMGPMVGAIEDSRFIPRVKPLYYLSNLEIEKYARIKGFPVAYNLCPCGDDAMRRHIRSYLDSIENTKPGTKLKMVEEFLRVLPRLREINASLEKIGACFGCGEPASNKLCKTCMILSKAQNGAGRMCGVGCGCKVI